jgi:hypothetical protein
VQRFRQLLAPFAGTEPGAAVTAPGHLDGVAETRVALPHGEAVGLFWREGSLLGLAPAEPPGELVLPLARAGERYATYHLGSEQYAELELAGDELMLHAGGRTVAAPRR